MTPRPIREAIHMTTAILWAQRSTCHRLSVGAVITNLDMTMVLAIGYNGPAKGLPNDRCRDMEGQCGCLHAEANAIAKVDSTIHSKQIFVTMQPCEMCASLIVNANITKVWYLNAYRLDSGLRVLEECGIPHFQLKRDLLKPLLPENLIYG